MLVAAYVLAAVPIALLALYGADVAAVQATGSGFLGDDHRVRGFSLGLPAMVMPFIAYVIARGRPSVGLGAMIVASGILIVAGGAFILASAPAPGADAMAESERNPAMEAAPLIVVGAVMAGLGALKSVRSRRHAEPAQ